MSSCIACIVLLILCLTISVYGELESLPEEKKKCSYISTDLSASNLYLIKLSYTATSKDQENDLYVDGHYESTMKLKNVGDEVRIEIIKMSQSLMINNCLLDKGKGFSVPGYSISTLGNNIYNAEFRYSSSSLLTLYKRLDIAFSTPERRLRPGDIYDRFWYNYNSSSWEYINTTLEINVNSNDYKPPYEVIRTAARPRNHEDSLELSWIPDNPNWRFYVYFYFAELEKLGRNEKRKFDIYWNGSPLLTSITPSYLYSTTVSNLQPLVAHQHRISLRKTNDSTHPPILNAIEIFFARTFI